MRLHLVVIILFLVIAACGRDEPPLVVFICGDMEKHTGNGPVADSADVVRGGTIRLDGACNEVVAFQAVLRAGVKQADLNARVTDLATSASSIGARNAELFLAHYAAARDASYSWGPSQSGVLPWKGELWPDALVPFNDPYSPAREPVAAPFAIDPARHRNQSVWVDLFIPKDTKAGIYTGSLEITQAGKAIKTFPIELRVHPFNLPDECHVDAFGELYRETGVMFDSGAKFKEHPEKDWPVYKRYLQMAHAHRFLATHRAENGPLPKTENGEPAVRLDQAWGNDWSLYTPYVDPVLNGTLFTEREGYYGPCMGVGPSFFPAPFVETFYGAPSLAAYLGKHNGRMDPRQLAILRDNAAAFRREAVARGWDKTRFFAYVMDEVDGVTDQGDEIENIVRTRKFHHAMRDIQRALDDGAGEGSISLMWTSHTDPNQWIWTPADLGPFIRWWVPNGHALNPEFVNNPEIKGTVWFYHSGRPAIGNHTINQTGIDLRLWGLLCATETRINGSFWWSMMNFAGRHDEPEFNPYDTPVYNEKDTRWGNGVLFYPGMRLTMIGARKNIAGPVSSMRMKAYRRGLQDYEYYWLVKTVADDASLRTSWKRLHELIPVAFSHAAGRKSAAWSEKPADYEKFRREMAGFIGSRKNR
ncbi:MAG: glycoside hydrolase domain-containing protein [Candidatus Sumerlaeia bacterium]